ncbi:sucrose phosphorylase [Rhodoferax sp. AJA081-3]|uniref:sucrose phosphorylase n=1 Tax=Rhodoferax sp. AJA081-3 TaxID=2752316 RepID=UPI001ADF3A2B|nr:sucrose phosphorylase [Rhodoferax sp. AJA081-3]QTN26654.1 sucrose phosphorylase [Rhodoferax sp. AJA081-3]
MKNQVQLITYVDRLGGGNLQQLTQLLDGPLKDVFGGVHLLPFFDAIDGADAGFDPTDHTQVDPRLGNWDDIRALSKVVDVMADAIVNHMSSASPQFQDFYARGDTSPFAGMFLTMDRVFPNGAHEQDLLNVYRPRPGLPFTAMALGNGQKKMLWTTFTPQQLDIDVQHPQGQAYLTSILQRFADNGIRMIRLDAAGYAIKKAGTSCFMLPETFDFIDRFAGQARSMGMEVLVEIHAYYQRQIEIAERVDWVYDFALPPLVLNTLFFGNSKALKDWIRIRPQNALTVLDTHDGIGIIDIGADPADRTHHPGLLPPEQLDRLVERIHSNSQGQSRQATGAAASNLDLYQVNCTFFDALGRNPRAYLLARAIQLFLPGVPQIYYVGLLAGENDMDLLAHSGVGRDINRQRFGADEIAQALEKPVVKDLLALIHLRNTCNAFNGTFEMLRSSEETLHLLWTHADARAELFVNLRDLDYRLTFTGQHPNSVRDLRFSHSLT